MMKKGSRGRDVEWLQIKLNTIVPSYLPPLSADGIFGAKSDARVKEFQKLSRLKIDGIAGRKTLEKMKSARTTFGPGLPPGFNPNEPPTTHGRPSGTNSGKGSDHQTIITTLSEAERKRVLKEAFKDVPDSVASNLEKFIMGKGLALKVVQLAEIAGLASPAVGYAAGAAGGLVLIPKLLLAWIKALETNERMYSTRAWAYTVTAWTHGAPRPQSSPEMLRRFRFSSDQTISARVKAWEKASMQTWQDLEAGYRRQKVSKQSFQLALQLIGLMSRANKGSIKANLCFELLKKREKEFKPGIEKSSWIDGYNVLYPR